MAERYRNIPIQKTLSGKVGYIPTLYPSLEAANNDYYIIARAEDRLDLIAFDFYGDATLWWIIATANDIPGDSMYPPMGFQLRIPNNSSDALNAYERANTNL
tara:strand:+ start:491 stop:796 length:306 start_codon:yes stop_codon:yes gene_type:complete